MISKPEDLVDNNDDGLIKGCIKGEAASQDKLYKKYAGKMFAVCYRYSRNREDAEDNLLEGFMKVFDNIASFKREGSFEGWIRRIMVNCSIEKLRRKIILYPVNNLESKQFEHFNSNDIISQLGANELIEMIQKLPPGYQMVFNLFVFEGLKHKEIAEKLGISEGTSKSNLSDARVILQRAVQNSSRVAKPAVNE